MIIEIPIKISKAIVGMLMRELVNLDFEELNRILITDDTDAIIANMVYVPIDGDYVASGNRSLQGSLKKS